jgi:hypothetical protein
MNEMKKEIKNQQDLNLAIASLEKKTNLQKSIIYDSFENLQENLKPVNLIIKHKEIILIAALGLGSGFLIRRYLLGKSTGVILKMAGTLIQWGLTGLITKNAYKIRANAGPIARHILKSNKPSTQIINIEAR